MRLFVNLLFCTMSIYGKKALSPSNHLVKRKAMQEMATTSSLIPNVFGKKKWIASYDHTPSLLAH